MHVIEAEDQRHNSRSCRYVFENSFGSLAIGAEKTAVSIAPTRTRLCMRCPRVRPVHRPSNHQLKLSVPPGATDVPVATMGAGSVVVAMERRVAFAFQHLPCFYDPYSREGRQIIWQYRLASQKSAKTCLPGRFALTRK
jgi:hypothetical protein